MDKVFCMHCLDEIKADHFKKCFDYNECEPVLTELQMLEKKVQIGEVEASSLQSSLKFALNSLSQNEADLFQYQQNHATK
jgi:hypothetical protein